MMNDDDSHWTDRASVLHSPRCAACDASTDFCAEHFGVILDLPLGYEAQMGHRVLVGPDPDGQGGSFGVVMGDKVHIVSTSQVGKLIRYRLGSHDDRVVVLVDGVAVETRAHDLRPWKGG
jgi:hypothetical protein